MPKGNPVLPSSRNTTRPHFAWLILLVTITVPVAFAAYWFIGPSISPTTTQRAPIESLNTNWEEPAQFNHPEFPGEEGAAPVAEAKADPLQLTARIRKNQTLFAALKAKGIEPSKLSPLIDAMSSVFDFRRSKPGDRYEAKLDNEGNILHFTYTCSPEEIYVAEFDGAAYMAKRVEINRNVETLVVSGTVKTTLNQAFVDLGEQGELSGFYMKIFASQIDFGSEARMGDSFSVIVDKVTLDGKFYRYSKIYAARYTRLDGETLSAYRFDDGESAEYYDEHAKPLKRFFLKTPIIGCVMTSPYDLRRMHPILRRIRPHYGVDWAGPTGTPIMAIADGVVRFADWKGANGYLLVIDHEAGYQSLNAHLHGFARGIKAGQKVKQGQVVAYLGNTGSSTGPHLHFGMKKNGKYIDPQKLENHGYPPLSGEKRKNFETYKTKCDEAFLSGSGAMLSSEQILPKH